MKTFQELGLGASMIKALSKLNITNPTEIQTKALPEAMAGKNIVATAQTGSGKTAAFLLPIIARLEPTGKLRALILAPTRELAKQIETNAKNFAAGTGLRCASIVGGENFSKQLSALRAGVDILIATPGRLNDLLNRNLVSFKSITIFVLDEADRMLDMGFLPQVQQITKYLPVKRQTMLMTATLSRSVEQLVFELMRDYVRVEANPRKTTVETLTQKAYPVLSHAKAPFLLAFLKENANKSVLVFTQTKMGADKLVRILMANHHQAVTLHSDRSQSQRNAALAKFRSGRVRVLVATDIAARGIDVDDIGFVVNYEVPATPEDYIHRVGRTARAGRDGAAITLVSPEEEFNLESIERITGIKLERLRLQGFSDGRSEKQILLADEINRLRAMQARSYRPRA